MTVTPVSYHGWADCYLLANGSVEALVVPAIGRVMQLRLEGAAEGATEGAAEGASGCADASAVTSSIARVAPR